MDPPHVDVRMPTGPPGIPNQDHDPGIEPGIEAGTGSAP